MLFRVLGRVLGSGVYNLVGAQEVISLLAAWNPGKKRMEAWIPIWRVPKIRVPF